MQHRGGLAPASASMAAILAGAALLAAGCGDGDQGTSASGDEPAAAATTTAPAAPTTDDPSSDTDGEPTDDAATDEAGVVDEDPATGEVETAATDDDADGSSVPATGEVETVTTEGVAALDGDALSELLAARYEAFWEVFGRARANPTAEPNLDYPALADLAADEQLDQASAELIELASSGRALRRPDNPAVPGLDQDSAHRIRIERVDDGVAELTVCFVNDRISYRVADGVVISDAVTTVTAEATMVRTDGTWKLVRSRAVALDPGVAGCWLDDEARYPW